jgi:hypothetical protein
VVHDYLDATMPRYVHTQCDCSTVITSPSIGMVGKLAGHRLCCVTGGLHDQSVLSVKLRAAACWGVSLAADLMVPLMRIVEGGSYGLGRQKTSWYSCNMTPTVSVAWCMLQMLIVANITTECYERPHS